MTDRPARDTDPAPASAPATPGVVCPMCKGDGRKTPHWEACPECDGAGGVPAVPDLEAPPAPRDDLHLRDAERLRAAARAALAAEAPAASLYDGKRDAGKARWDLLPWGAVGSVVAVLTRGAHKGRGWASLPNGRARYTAALMRHLTAWIGGSARDPDSGLHPLAHVACNALFLLALAEGSAERDAPALAGGAATAAPPAKAGAVGFTRGRWRQRVWIGGVEVPGAEVHTIPGGIALSVPPGLDVAIGSVVSAEPEAWAPRYEATIRLAGAIHDVKTTVRVGDGEAPAPAPCPVCKGALVGPPWRPVRCPACAGGSPARPKPPPTPAPSRPLPPGVVCRGCDGLGCSVCGEGRR